ncbi:MAG: hypothetical protein JXR03_09575 [Cyclobacteriaceae bacterium]
MMAKSKSKPIPEGQRVLYEKLVAILPELSINNQFGFPYTSINGHMFSLLSKSGYVGIRLPKEKREHFLEQYQTTLYQPNPGPLLKEYVTVPNHLLEDSETLKEYLKISFEYVKSLKPKPQKKK